VTERRSEAQALGCRDAATNLRPVLGCLADFDDRAMTLISTERSEPRNALPGLGAGNVWLLEDSPLDVERTRKVLSASAVRVFDDGPALLEELAKGDLPDVLVLDWELTGLSGIEVCRFVRRLFDRLTLPVIMLTSHTDKEHIVEALAAGANDYVSKPFHASELYERVSAAIRTRRLFVRLVETNSELERERARVAESEAKYRRLADSGLIGIVETDLSGALLDANDAFLALVGRQRAELASGRLKHDPECRPLDERAIHELLETGVTSHYEKELVRSDGQPVIARIAVARLGLGSDRCVGYVLDVTHERGVEADRARLFDAERRARADAELASRMKDDFLAMVSHELRTPMNAIVGWAEILQRRTDLNPELVRAVDVIHRNARAQAKMIEDILDVSRVIAGKVRLEPKPIDLIGVIELAIDAIRPALEAKGVSIVTDLRDPVIQLVADGDRVQQVVWNLLSNAVKFTPQGGKVRVGACTDDGRAIIEVEDSGAGIAPENLVAIFERFRQVDPSTTRSYGGLGLGLAIVRHLVELHGGTVRASSAGLGRGATFVVRLPLRAMRPESAEIEEPVVEPEPAPVENRIRRSVAGLKVLVVDDEPDSRMLCASILRAADAEVAECSSVEEALDRLPDFMPDVLLTDIAMPHADGFELLARMRRFPAARGGETPAIAVTAYARDEDAARTRAAGFRWHVSKPIDTADLLSAVADCRALSDPARE
jgi:PAS domain S-box-containing protein